MRIAIVLLSSLFLLSCEADKTPDVSGPVPIQQDPEVTTKSTPDSEQTDWCPERTETSGQSVVSVKPASPCQPPEGKIRAKKAWFPTVISILPEDWAIPVGEQVQFSHSLQDAPAALTKWTVNGIPGGDSIVGTIDQNGLYTAPSVVPTANPVAVRATWYSDPSVFSESPVAVTEAPSESGITWTLMTPRVIDVNSPAGTVTVEIGFAGYPNLQLFQWNTQQLTNPPRAEESQGELIEAVALRTGVYAWRISMAEVIAQHEEGVLQQGIGILHCDMCDSNPTNVSISNFGRWIRPLFNDSTIPSVPVSAIAPDFQASTHVVNMAVSRGDAAMLRIDDFLYFYQYFPDAFDFLAFVFADNVIGGPSGTGGPRQNAITGIGLTIFEDYARLGSAGRLQGSLSFWQASVADWTGIVSLHEMAHRWLVYLSEPPINSSLYGSHWPSFSSFNNGIIRCCHGWRYEHVSENVYQVNCPPAAEIGPKYEFSDFELYLMGLLGPDEIGPQIIFDEPTLCNQQGTATVVTMDDIIATYGARSPDYTESQKDFTMATIILSKDRLLTPHEMAYFNHMAERGERTVLVPDPVNPNELRNPFFLATRGRATLSTRILP